MFRMEESEMQDKPHWMTTLYKHIEEKRKLNREVFNLDSKSLAKSFMFVVLILFTI